MYFFHADFWHSTEQKEVDLHSLVRFRRVGLVDNRIFNFNQLGLVVLHVLDERVSGVVGTEE